MGLQEHGEDQQGFVYALPDGERQECGTDCAQGIRDYVYKEFFYYGAHYEFRSYVNSLEDGAAAVWERSVANTRRLLQGDVSGMVMQAVEDLRTAGYTLNTPTALAAFLRHQGEWVDHLVGWTDSDLAVSAFHGGRLYAKVFHTLYEVATIATSAGGSSVGGRVARVADDVAEGSAGAALNIESAAATPSSLLRSWGRLLPRDTHVYIGFRTSPATGQLEPVYVGITRNFPRRAQEHLRRGRFDDVRQLSLNGLTRRQARAIEQVLIETNPHYDNLINSISPLRSFYDEALDWGDDWLRHNGIDPRANDVSIVGD